MGSTTVSKNAKGYGYKYADLSQIHDYLESINMKYYQYIENYEGNDYIYTVPIKILEDGTEQEYPPRRGCRIIQPTSSGKVNMAQENGSAITYARRYSLLMAFGLATEDDDAQSVPKTDAKTTTEKKSSNKTPEKTEEQLNQEMIDSVDKDLVVHNEGITESRLEKLENEIKRTGYDREKLCRLYNVKDFKDLTEVKYCSCMEQLMKKETKA